MKRELNFNCESVQGELDSKNEGVKKTKYNEGDRICEEDCSINFRDEVPRCLAPLVIRKMITV